MWVDPIVDEVRKARIKIENDCDHNWDKIFQRINETQEKYKNRLVSRPGLEKVESK